jgi:YbgC/YbaW family acyl-CoA thioester hydrolase
MTENLSVHIYPSDCDSVGHVNHAHMLTLLERARWGALERHMSYDTYMKSNLWAVVRKVEASYMAQTFPGDDLSIRTGLTSVGNTSFIVRQEVKNQRGAVVCDASIVYVTVSNDGKPIPVPDQWRTLFSPWEEEKPR